MVRPGCILKLLHFQWPLSAVLQLCMCTIIIAYKLLACTHSDLHSPDGIVSKDLLLCEGDLEGTKLFAATVWPVLLTLLLVALLQVGYHDNGGGPLLPHQPPEINQHILFRAYNVI